jgi:hypothetical protein
MFLTAGLVSLIYVYLLSGEKTNIAAISTNSNKHPILACWRSDSHQKQKAI